MLSSASTIARDSTHLPTTPLRRPRLTRAATLRSAVAEVVCKQAEAGVDVVSDGEFGKSTWFTYIMERLDGYEVRPVDRPTIGFLGRDEKRYPYFFRTAAIASP